MGQSKTIFMIAGESSGDFLGADLSRALQTISPDLSIVGVGGPKMIASGVTVIEDMEQLSIIGFIDVIKHIYSLLSLINRVKAAIINHKPDIIVLIDAPGFNLRIARWAATHAIKVVYYVSPQLWAWKPKRIHLIRQAVSHMAVLLPFELALYQRYEVDVSLVQHPLYLAAHVSTNKSVIYQKYGLDPSKPVMLLMPGSRESEVRRHLSIMLKTWLLWQQTHENWQCVCLAVNHLDASLYQVCLDKGIPCVIGDNHSLLSIGSACLCCSGTATLEVALHRVPMVVVYRTSWFNFIIAKCLVKVKYIALCNLIVDQPVVPEFIQTAVKPKRLVASLHQLIFDARQFALLQENFEAIDQSFCMAQPSASLAQLLLRL